MRKFLQFFLLLILAGNTDVLNAQVTSPADTLKTIEIIRGKSLREMKVDSVTTIQTIAGDVELHEGTTKFTCDSAIINRSLNTMEAFGNVHINQGDSLFTSSDYIRYLGNERTAFLKRNVKLTDKKAVLTTQELEYNLTTGVGKYFNGGKVVNGKTVLTSKEGTYYEETKDVYFINKVDVVDQKTRIKADSLLYNTLTKTLNFIGPTFIKNKDGDIFTTQGTYDLSKGNAFFGNNTLIKDSSGRVYTAKNIAFDEKLGQTQFQGQAIIKDSANKFIITGNEIFSNRQNNSFLATRKPVLIIWEGKDTTYIAADTLFSGFTKKRYEIDTAAVSDSLKHLPATDTITKTKKGLVRFNSITGPVTTAVTDTKVINKTTDTARAEIDSIALFSKADTAKTSANTLKSNAIKKTGKDTTNKVDSIRYFLAYHHVRIFNDSLQAVSDSLFYSAADSTFRLFYEPVIWNGKSQLTGDTIFLYTKNKKVERIYVFENGIMLNRISSDYYNQVAGKTINGYFKDGVIDFMRIKGSPAESIYYVQDQDSAFTGMNHADGSVIEMFFIKQQLDKVKVINDVHGKFYPIRQIPSDQKFLKKFAWLEKRRPKNKLELFE